MIVTVNPYTNKKIKEYPILDAGQLEQKIQKSHSCFNNWRKLTFEQRANKLKNLAQVLLSEKEIYARNISIEMGKPISQAIAEVEKCAWVCEYYAKNGYSFLKEEDFATDATRSYVRFDPLGVILAVMPWNYPFWQVFRFAAPALMAGNTALLKHASNVMGCALLIEEAFCKAGFPKHTFQNLIIKSDKVKNVISHPLVRAATLTGSKPAGAAVASEAARYIKKSVLELGGSNAFIVCKSANIKKAVEVAVNARFQNTGQSCIAAKRLLLQKEIANEFMDDFKEAIKNLKSGDPLHKETYIGVMAREDLAEELEAQLKTSIQMGGKVVLGGKRKSTYFEPTILLGATMEMPVFQEETFGPVLGVAFFDDIEEAIKIVNESAFGLGVSLFSEDEDEVEYAIPKFEDGAVFINEMVKSDPRLPFGGTKISGYGRELGYFGIREFVNIKTVYKH